MVVVAALTMVLLWLGVSHYHIFMREAPWARAVIVTTSLSPLQPRRAFGRRQPQAKRKAEIQTGHVMMVCSTGYVLLDYLHPGPPLCIQSGEPNMRIYSPVHVHLLMRLFRLLIFCGL